MAAMPPPGHGQVRRHVRLTRTILLWLILLVVSFVYYRMLSRVRSSLPLVSAPGIAAVAGGGNGGDSESKERGQVRKRVPEKDDFAPGRPRPGRAVPSKRAPLPAKPLPWPGGLTRSVNWRCISSSISRFTRRRSAALFSVSPSPARNDGHYRLQMQKKLRAKKFTEECH